ncbi:response regulator [Litoribacter populi]|uniref:response regulator n=1 Tax=Litoribacter populi TaxID=2598460 RepID=UPI00117E3621|nr:response regulator [Litoribacter populi]
MDDEAIDILLIEDNKDDADLIKRALKKSQPGIQILHFDDGEQALDILFKKNGFSKSHDKLHLKLIIVDLKMPKIDGFEVLKAVKNNTTTQTIPVAVLTSSNQMQDIQACYEMGVNSYIVKPVDFEEFTKTIQEMASYWLDLNKYITNY